MSNFFQRLRAKSGRKSLDDPGENPVAVAGFTDTLNTIMAAAAAHGEATAAAEYETFCATFHHRPGVKFADFVAAHEVARLRNWLRPETPEPEPKAFIRLILKMQEQGTDFWEEDGVTIFLKRRSAHGGGPSPESAACVSLLAQVLGKTIIYKYPDPHSEMIEVVSYAP